MTGTGLRVIVGPPSMHWRNRCPAQGGWRYWLSWNTRRPTWRLWARDAAIEKKDVLKGQGYSWSAGQFGRPKCWYRDVSDADKAAELSWLRENVMGPDQAVWALRITARDRYSNRCWCWGERLGTPLECPADRSGGRWIGVIKPDIVPNWPSFVEKSALRADSLAGNRHRTLAPRMAALRTHGDAIDQDDAVTEEIDWFVFTRAA